MQSNKECCTYLEEINKSSIFIDGMAIILESIKELTENAQLLKLKQDCRK